MKVENGEKKEEKEKNSNSEEPKKEQLLNEEIKDKNTNIIEEKDKDKNKEDAEKKTNVNNNIDSNRQIDSNLNRNSSTLIIEEIDCNLLNGQKLKINAQGMEGGRGLKDGVTIFGCNSNENNNNEKNQAMKSDFNFNFQDNKSLYPYIFMIYFEKEMKSYFIRPYIGKNEENKSLYIKLNHENKLFLKQKELIIAGNILFQVNPIDNNKLEIVNLSKENASIPRQSFDASSKKEVTIGRSKECDFSFPDNKSFSRIHTTFEYDEESKGWVIIDGSKIKSSTNGTWILCTHSFQIKNIMVIEIMNFRLQITEENKNG